MKKLLMITIVLLMLVAVSACGKQTTTVCKYDNTPMVATNTYIAKGDKVTEMTYDYAIDIKAAGYTEETVRETVEEEAENFNSKPGITYSYRFEGDLLKYTIVVEVDKATMADLQALGVVDSSADNVASISLSKTIESVKASNFTCE